MRDVARAAGVSVATVSYVVNGRHGRVSAATRDRVEHAVRALDFRPSAPAQQLRGKGSRTLGLIVRHLQDPSTTALIRGAEHAAAERGYRLILCDLDRQMDRAAPYARTLVAGRVDAVFLVFAYPQLADVAAILAARGVPCAAFLPGGHQVSLPPGVPLLSVAVDSDPPLRALVAHLAALGHRRLAFVSHARAGAHQDQRAGVFRRAVAELGLAPDEGLCLALDVAEAGGDANDDLRAGQEAAHRLYARARPPTAVVAASDTIALGVLQGAWELGWRVPERLSVTGFDDTPFARAAVPPLTTARVPMYEAGRAGAAALVELLAGGQPASQVFVPEVVPRRSTAPAPVDAPSGVGAREETAGATG